MPSIVILDGIIPRIKYRRRERYLKKKYADKPPRIYCDSRYDVSICPTNIKEYGTVNWVSSELSGTGLIFHYMLEDKMTHEHDFDSVLLDAYNNAEIFSIPEEFRDEYSEQELDFIQKLTERALRDRGGEK